MALALSIAMALKEVTLLMAMSTPVESVMPLATRIPPVRGGVLLSPPPHAHKPRRAVAMKVAVS